MSLKKKLISAVVSVSLTLSLIVPVSASSEPTVGNKSNGFTLVETGSCKIYDAKTYLFRHNKTGGQVLYVANDDANRAFDIAFNTPAEDTGVSHVFEHASLNGSEKYPSNIFFNISYETINTYMNASTYPKVTSFPISSISDEQLLKLADYYLDGVFNPLIMTNEDIFEQEAWRYELESADSELKLNGTVYSEMKGALSPDTKAVYNALKLLYPNSHTSAISGGDPDVIPSLTYEDLVKYHNDYYRPSNSLVILYGKLDYEKYLKLIDGYFSDYDDIKPNIADDAYTPVSGNIEKTFPIQASETAGNTVFYLLPCNITDENALFDFIFCTQFIDSDSSVLKQKIKTEMPNVDVSLAAELSVGVVPTLLIAATNVQSGEEHKLRELIDSSFAELAEKGFSEKFIDAFVTSLEREILTISEAGGNKGITFINSINSMWSIFGNYDTYLNYVEYLMNIDGEKLNDTYKKVISDYLVSPSASVFTINAPDSSIAKKNEAALSEKLSQIKSEMSEEEIAEIVQKTKKGKDNTVNTELVDKINVSTVDILKKDMDSYKTKEYECSDMTEDGVRYLYSEADIGDIGYAGVYLDISGFSDEQLLYFDLYDNISLKFGTTKHSQAEIYDIVSRYISGRSGYLLTDENDLYMVYNMTVLNKDIDKTYDVLYELLYDIQIDDTEYLKSITDSLINDWETSVLDESAVISRAEAQKSDKKALSSYLSGLDFYEFLKLVRKKLDENPDEVTNNLKTVQNLLKNKNNAKFVYAGNAEGIKLTKKYAKEFFDKLDDKALDKAEHNFPIPCGNEALFSNTDINYNLIFAPYEELGIEREGSLAVTLNMMNDRFFMPYLRNEKGAYGVSLGLDNVGMYICSYRDPQILSTFEYYDTLSDILSNTEFTQSDIDGYIMSTFSKRAINRRGLLSDVYYMLKSKIYNDEKDDYEMMTEILDTTPEKVKSYAPVFKKLAEIGIRGTVGKKTDILSNKGLYDSIIDPFSQEIKISYCGKRIYSDVAPIIENDRVLVPARAIFEAMGCDVSWQEDERKIVVTKDEKTVTLYISSDVMTTDGAEIQLDAPAKIYEDRTLVPVRAIAESLGTTVDWVAETGTVVLMQ